MKRVNDILKLVIFVGLGILFANLLIRALYELSIESIKIWS